MEDMDFAQVESAKQMASNVPQVLSIGQNKKVKLWLGLFSTKREGMTPLTRMPRIPSEEDCKKVWLRITYRCRSIETLGMKVAGHRRRRGETINIDPPNLLFRIEIKCFF